MILSMFQAHLRKKRHRHVSNESKEETLKHSDSNSYDFHYSSKYEIKEPNTKTPDPSSHETKITTSNSPAFFVNF